MTGSSRPRPQSPEPGDAQPLWARSLALFCLQVAVALEAWCAYQGHPAFSSFRDFKLVATLGLRTGVRSLSGCEPRPGRGLQSCRIAPFSSSLPLRVQTVFPAIRRLECKSGDLRSHFMRARGFEHIVHAQGSLVLQELFWFYRNYFYRQSPPNSGSSGDTTHVLGSGK